MSHGGYNILQMSHKFALVCVCVCVCRGRVKIKLTLHFNCLYNFRLLLLCETATQVELAHTVVNVEKARPQYSE